MGLRCFLEDRLPKPQVSSRIICLFLLLLLVVVFSVIMFVRKWRENSKNYNNVLLGS